MRCRRNPVLRLLLVVALVGVPVAIAQTLLIPDFRERANIRTLGPGETCKECGRIISVREIQIDRRDTLPVNFQGAARGPVDHNLVGAVVYLPLGGGSNDRPFVGGVGTPEMRERFAQSTYEITVRMEEGAMRSFRRADGARYHAGDRVRATASGELEWVAE
jgi:outer membrane lipoprotein SlyB